MDNAINFPELQKHFGRFSLYSSFNLNLSLYLILPNFFNELSSPKNNVSKPCFCAQKLATAASSTD